MKLQEYASRHLFVKYGIPAKPFYIVRNAREAKDAAQTLKLPVVVKAQVLVGGRGKAGGIKLAQSPEEAESSAEEILNLTLKGIKVKKVLVAEAVDIDREFYLSIILDRVSKKPLIIASSVGGVDIEDIAKNNPDAIKKFYIDPLIGLKPYTVRRVVRALFGNTQNASEAGVILLALYKLFIETGATLVEINPFAMDKSGKLWAVDAKIILDDAGLSMRPNLADLRDTEEEDKGELEAGRYGLSYVKLAGNIGCIVNGAGLAMGTMDTINHMGGTPANFLDVGGSASAETVAKGFEIILKNKKVKAIFVNIFGGIVRCDRIANGIIEATKITKVNVPVIVRLDGTNAKEASEILSQAKISNLIVADDLGDGAKKAVKALTAKKPRKKPAAKKTTTKKPVAKKTTTKKPVAKKTTPKKTTVKKTTTKKDK